jgi:hypothetical protein
LTQVQDDCGYDFTSGCCSDHSGNTDNNDIKVQWSLSLFTSFS